ncbi:MAG: hypothetical protein IJI73_02495 [Kiritimatiellae bacterium]|nr:hypothetical protein [Kiritimatiellia bacterium]
MKSLEILSTLPKWAKARPRQIVDSPAFAMPCRLGEDSATLRLGAVEPADTLDLSILFGDEPHTLRLARSPRFAELDKVWDSRADVPEPVLLALVEKDCGAFFQLLENAVRRQLRLSGLAAADSGSPALAAQVADIIFSLTRSDTVLSAFGNIRNLDLSDPSLRSEPLQAEVEYAAFALPASDVAALAPGDALLLPEIGAVAPRLVADGRFVVDAAGVAPFSDDGRCRVVAADPVSVTLGELFDAADGKVPDRSGVPAGGGLRLLQGGQTIAQGRLDRLADQPAFIVEAT